MQPELEASLGLYTILPLPILFLSIAIQDGSVEETCSRTPDSRCFVEER